MEPKSTANILIVGGGITGLSAALFLLQQGIKPLLIERRENTSIHPRARGFDVRTMELYRELGLSEQIREVGKALSPSWGIHKSSSLAEALRKVEPRKGEAIQFPTQMKGMEKLAALSPEAGARCTQDLSEPVLLAAAVDRGADIRFYTELASFEQNGEGVTALIRNRETGEEKTVVADYMIAADGAKSRIREALKAKTSGKGALGYLLNIYFEADLAEFVRGREFSILLVNEPAATGMLTSINNTDRWVFHLHYDAANGERPEDYPTERITAILQKVIGLPGLPIRVISVLPWQPTVRVADDMGHGRIFLAGDAAHVMTPFGGKGANTGVQDVHNLAWKLAAVLRGKAPSALLRTYNAERQPVGLHYAKLSGDLADRNGLLKRIPVPLIRAFSLVKAIQFLRLEPLLPKTAMLQLGGFVGLPEYRYAAPGRNAESAQSPESAPCRGFKRAGSLTAKPGTRFPHLWVEYKHEKISTLDLLGKSFVLFTGINNEAWLKAINTASAHQRIPLAVYSIGTWGDLFPEGDVLKPVFGITDTGAILVRPDGFVAWRSAGAPLGLAQFSFPLG